MGEYTSETTGGVLFLSIYFTNFCFGFFNDDMTDSSTVSINTWYHVAFVFDKTTLHRGIYVNGQVSKNVRGWGVLQSNVGGATIGGRVTSMSAYYTGYIDHVTVNVIDANNNTISATTPSTLIVNTWTHIAQTFSRTSGVRLYINGYPVASVSASTGRSVGPYTFIGASPSGTSYCNAGSIATGQFYGSIDEYRVFRNELTAIDVCRLANPA